tara:strand:+ start:121 stop:939 length:819 start_codon:yes stop_codon:yes gene_type:complete
MTNVFAGKQAAAGSNIEEDFTGGGGGLLDTDVYMATIKTAYIQKAKASEATSIILLMDINGKELRSQTWVTNRNGEVTYKDKKTGEVKNLPGFSQMNSLALLVAGKELGQLDSEEKTVKLYDFDAKKEIPQAVMCFTELHGETVAAAVQRQTVDKTAKNEATGSYDATGETRDQNEVVKFFAADKLVTISEVEMFIKSLGASFDETVADGHLLKAIGKMEDASGVYSASWIEKNQGQTYVKAKGKAAGAGKAFAGGAASAAPAAKVSASLFD